MQLCSVDRTPPRSALFARLSAKESRIAHTDGDACSYGTSTNVFRKKFQTVLGSGSGRDLVFFFPLVGAVTEWQVAGADSRKRSCVSKYGGRWR